MAAQIMPESPPPPTRLRVGDLSEEQVGVLCALYDRIWPAAGATLFARREAVRAGWVQDAREVFLIGTREDPVALAMTFPRVISTAVGLVRVLALAGVCCAPEQRGRGFGAAVVRAAFAPVDNGEYNVALFQTGVPVFYTKLGAREVENEFENSGLTGGGGGTVARPWWDPHVMIYPARFPWPEGTIDLLGPGY